MPRCAACATAPTARPRPPQFNVVTVETGGRAPTPTPRLGTTSSSCGWCGSDQIDELLDRLAPLPPSPPFDARRCSAAVPDSRRSTARGCSTSTGAVHAAAAFDRDGQIIARRARTSAATTPSTRSSARCCSRERCRRRVAACSSAAGPSSRWCRRRGRPGSPRSSPSAHRRRWPSSARRAELALTLAGVRRATDGFNARYARRSLSAMRTEIGRGCPPPVLQATGRRRSGSRRCRASRPSRPPTARSSPRPCSATSATSPSWRCTRTGRCCATLQSGLQARRARRRRQLRVASPRSASTPRACPSTCCTTGCTRRCRPRASRSSASTR